MHYEITPVAKPRMTQRDKWLKPPRPAVGQYLAFKDEVRWRKVELPTAGTRVTFIMPMPRSWSKKKHRQMEGQPHQQTPDLDNLLKALSDAVYENDCEIWDIRATKLWGKQGAIRIEPNAQGSVLVRMA